jgi:hypothetical protein
LKIFDGRNLREMNVFCMANFLFFIWLSPGLWLFD